MYFSLKWTYLAFLCLFEVGSLICATAVSSVMLIVGRAVAGMGAAGLFSGALVIISHSIPLRQRPSKSLPCLISFLSFTSTHLPQHANKHVHSLYRLHSLHVWRRKRRRPNSRRRIHPTPQLALVLLHQPPPRPHHSSYPNIFLPAHRQTHDAAPALRKATSSRPSRPASLHPRRRHASPRCAMGWQQICVEICYGHRSNHWFRGLDGVFWMLAVDARR